MFKKLSRFLFSLLVFLTLAVLTAAVCLLIVKPPFDLSQSAAYTAVEPDFPEKQPPVLSDNATALARAFSHPLPALPGQACEGEVRSVSFEGNNALLTTIQYDSFSLTCVQPALAAPLLLRLPLQPATVQTDDASSFSILSMPAVYLYGGRAHCFYFSDDSAAYALFSDTLDLSSLAIVASSLKWIN